MVAAKNSAASATPASGDLPFFHDPCHAQSPETGRNASREVLVRPATPHSMPKAIHGFAPERSSISSVSHKITANSNAAKLVSHIKRVHQYITGGNRAHIQEVQAATRS